MTSSRKPPMLSREQLDILVDQHPPDYPETPLPVLGCMLTPSVFSSSQRWRLFRARLLESPGNLNSPIMIAIADRILAYRETQPENLRFWSPGLDRSDEPAMGKETP